MVGFYEKDPPEEMVTVEARNFFALVEHWRATGIAKSLQLRSSQAVGYAAGWYLAHYFDAPDIWLGCGVFDWYTIFVLTVCALSIVLSSKVTDEAEMDALLKLYTEESSNGGCD
jgi:hypothetical protein